MDRVCCAIYTRKSTSEGLEGDFTSLDAQRESALNYIASQKNEGWQALPNRYDDGGFTGANTERPALQRLLDDIKAGGINCVVVYKVDRLSRSLTDFARLLEFFDKNGVTFVSVTQHFNTTNSMGRLTLNILLSFAQFEREIISERTKDKMSAARKKGRYVGGRPALGYDVDKKAKALVVNPVGAKLVRQIFDAYVRKRSLLAVANDLNERGVRTKLYASERGKASGGRAWGKNDVAAILNNYLYIGKVRYEGQVYDGLHEAVIPAELFEQVQKLMAESRAHRNFYGNTQHCTLLRQILWCGSCKRRMTPTYSSKKNVKYRYYVCQVAQSTGYANCPTKTVRAQEIEAAVVEKAAWILAHTPEYKDKNLVLNTPTWELLFPQERRRVLNRIVKSVEYDAGAKKLAIELNDAGIKDLEAELA